MNDFKREEIRRKAAIVTNYTLCLQSYDKLFCKNEDNSTKLDELCELKTWFETGKHKFNGKIINSTLMKNTDNGLIIKIQFDDTGNRTNYYDILVKIYNRSVGQIDAMSFRFNDYSLDGKNYRVWENNDINWYINVPDTAMRQRITDAVFDYIAIWEG